MSPQIVPRMGRVDVSSGQNRNPSNWPADIMAVSRIGYVNLGLASRSLMPSF